MRVTTSDAPHGRHQHRKYQMGCVDFDHLWSYGAGRCGICDTPAEETRQGKLHIDHDHARGDWAVRGLLCMGCNTGLGAGHLRHELAVDRYLTRAWVDVRFRDAVEQRPEPAIGSCVTIRRRVWTRSEVCWWPSGELGWDAQVHTWDRMNHAYGPHNIHHLPAKLVLIPSSIVAAKVKCIAAKKTAVT